MSKSSVEPQKMNEAIARVRSCHLQGEMLSYKSRLQHLRNLRRFIIEQEDAVVEALALDLSKSHFEAILWEINVSTVEVDFAISNLKSWMKPESVSSPLCALPASSSIQSQAKGVVLIIGPFNYPFQLLVIPLVAAISAGNTAVIHASHLAPATSSVFAKLLNLYVSADVVAVVEGDIKVTQYLLSQRFDHIFFTGSSPVGKLVLKAAAEYITPVTLELGGKCPAIVMPSTNIEVSARRIMWSKWINAGQTCVAVDYALVHSSIAEEFIEKCVYAVEQFSANSVGDSKSYPRIVTKEHTRSIQSLIEDGVKAGAVIRCGGKVLVEEQYIEPTVVSNVLPNNPLMEQELFAPVLPVVSVDSLDDAIHHIIAGEKPLALYLFSSNEEEVKNVLDATFSGGICINDVILHLCNPKLPFGGVGYSGMGSYHGKAGFDELSHKRSVMHRSCSLDISERYPPYSDNAERMLRFVSGITKLNSKNLQGYVAFLVLYFVFVYIWFY